MKRNALADDELIVAVLVEPSGQPQTFMKIGPRNAMVIAVCSLAVVADRERGELRAAFGSAAPGVPSRHRPARRGRRRSPSRSPRQRARSTTSAEPPPTAATPSASSRGARSTGASREDRADGQRGAARGRRLGRREPADDASRPPRPARLEERVRAGRVRLVLGAPRRRARVRLPRARGAGGRPRGRDRGRARRRRRPAPRAGGVRGRGSGAVRLLHARASSSRRPISCAASPIRRTTRSARRSPATSAAARATQKILDAVHVAAGR